MMVGEIYK
jgi:hypothetical protein